MISVLTPLTSSSGSHLSATFSEASGCTALTIPDDSLMMAVTLVHELQHAKLYSLIDLLALTQGESSERHYAPWRDDPRPIDALLQGAYAHLGLTAFWRRRRRTETGGERLQAEVQFARWRSASLTAVDTLLASGGLTPAGVVFVSTMRETLSAWNTEPVAPSALSTALDLNIEHRARWEAAHGAP
ncbi:HEXXH motif-containing putative peptide modification protein [Streptomyces sp. NPDC051907]|uniref:aKG-HExxH-type peptide beta-hydroxylase n=1 Tax=Streptomyces sp. NPDC051907 TaxID=3155284 RepID=UPI00342E7315